MLAGQELVTLGISVTGGVHKLQTPGWSSQVRSMAPRRSGKVRHEGLRVGNNNLAEAHTDGGHHHRSETQSIEKAQLTDNQINLVWYHFLLYESFPFTDNHFFP